MKHKTHTWAYLVFAILVLFLCLGCSTLDNLLGVNDPSGAPSPLVTGVEQTGILFGPIGQAIAGIVTSLAGAYVLIRRSKTQGDKDHGSNVEAICALQKEIDSLKGKKE